MSSLADDLRTFIVEELEWSGNPATLTDDYPLIDKRVVDSVALVQLVSYLEDRFDIEIDEEELTRDNFATLKSITDFVEEKV